MSSATLPLLRWPPLDRFGLYSLPTVELLLAACVFAFVVLFVTRRRFVRLPLTLTAALFLGLIVCVFAGCGGGSNGGGGTPSTATYTVQVVATVHGSAPAASRSATITLMIQR
jgi:hypothetical protein